MVRQLSEGRAAGGRAGSREAHEETKRGSHLELCGVRDRELWIARCLAAFCRIAI
jgi:hypothetical protein